MKKTIISSVICLVVGVIIGICGYYLYQKKQNTGLNNNISIETINGDPGIIKIDKVTNKPGKIEMNIKSEGKGEIKTTIKKSAFCPKIYKNSLTFILYGGIMDLQPVISYGINYRRQVFSRFHVMTGLKIDTNIYRINGFQLNLGVGVNF